MVNQIEAKSNLLAQHQLQTPIKNTVQQPKTSAASIKSEIRDEFIKEKRKNGLVEKAYNWLKNVTGLGLGSKKVEADIALYEQGQKSEEEVRENIKKYRSSQYNSQQALGDIASLGAGMAVYSKVSNLIKKQSAQNKLGGNMLSAMGEGLENFKYSKGLVNFFKNMTKTKRIALATTASAIVGAFAKEYIIKFDRIGSKEYKSDIPKNDKEQRLERKRDQKLLNRERRGENWKNFFRGGLNGIIAPLANLGGGLAGVPLVIAANLGTRYVQAQKDKDAKISLKDFVNKFEDNIVFNSAVATVAAVPLFKKAKYNKVLTENLSKVVTKLKDAKLKPTFSSNKTAYTELQDMLINSDNLGKILNDYKLPIDKKIQAVIDENIFAAKFLQNGGFDAKLTHAMKENCPATRTLQEAKELIEQTFGKKYEPTKLLGVGTVAESYLAKNLETGEEVCIKMMKKGINADKITADKEKMIALVKSQVTDEKQLQYYINNIEDLAKGIGAEVDLKNEMEAAKRLAKFTKEANIVKPLEIKDNIYIMEKARGISLKTLQDVSSLEASKNTYTKLMQKQPDQKAFYEKEIAQIDKKIKEIKAKSPDFDKIDITPKEIDNLLSQYIKAQTEQFDSLYKNGKTLHGDIHPGNVFVDLKALKSGKGKALTLIDTGNVIDLTMEQSRTALKLKEYVDRGNVKDIADYVIEGAILPEKMTKEAAKQTMEKELRKVFFDSESALDYMNNDSILALSANIMKKHNIIPASTQLNLERAKHHGNISLQNILETFINTKYSNFDAENNKGKAALMVTKDLMSWGKRIVTAKKLQEAKNATQYPLKQIISSKGNPNMLKTNSEDYLTYKFKQNMGKSLGDLNI